MGRGRCQYYLSIKVFFFSLIFFPIFFFPGWGKQNAWQYLVTPFCLWRSRVIVLFVRFELLTLDSWLLTFFLCGLRFRFIFDIWHFTSSCHCQKKISLNFFALSFPIYLVLFLFSSLRFNSEYLKIPLAFFPRVFNLRRGKMPYWWRRKRRGGEGKEDCPFFCCLFLLSILCFFLGGLVAQIRPASCWNHIGISISEGKVIVRLKDPSN